MEVARSVSLVLGLQHLLEQSSIVELFEGFSEAEWNGQEQAETESPEETSACQNDVDKYIPYFCGSLRQRASNVLKGIIDRSCEGDSYQRGWFVDRRS